MNGMKQLWFPNEHNEKKNEKMNRPMVKRYTNQWMKIICKYTSWTMQKIWKWKLNGAKQNKN